MADRKPVTRANLQRELIVNATTKPVNVAVPVAVAVVGIVLGTVWLYPVALVVYIALALMTFFDGGEAKRVGDKAYGRGKPAAQVASKTFAPPIRGRLDTARAEQAAIAKTIADSDLTWADVSGEVSALISAMEAAARRAQKLLEYLASQDIADLDRRIKTCQSNGQSETAYALLTQRSEIERLDKMLEDAYGEMDQVIASLKTVHARLVGAAVSSTASADADLAGDVRELRQRIESLTDGLQTT